MRTVTVELPIAEVGDKIVVVNVNDQFNADIGFDSTVKSGYTARIVKVYSPEECKAITYQNVIEGSNKFRESNGDPAYTPEQAESLRQAIYGDNPYEFMVDIVVEYNNNAQLLSRVHHSFLSWEDGIQAWHFDHTEFHEEDEEDFEDDFEDDGDEEGTFLDEERDGKVTH